MGLGFVGGVMLDGPVSPGGAGFPVPVDLSSLVVKGVSDQPKAVRMVCQAVAMMAAQRQVRRYGVGLGGRCG